MKVLFTLVVVLLAGGVAIGLFRHSEVRELRDHNETLRGTLEELQRLREENDRLAGLSVDVDLLERLRSEQNELLRLRAEVTQLRRTALSTVPELQGRIQKTLADAEAAAKKFESIRAHQEAERRRAGTQSLLRLLFDIIHESANQTRGPLPGSFQQLELTLSQLPDDNRIRIHGQEVLNHTNRFGLSARDFEFLPQTRPVTVQDESVLLLREREPRPHPDGGWLRAYGFSDGRTEEAFSEDGNFDAWERNAWAR